MQHAVVVAIGHQKTALVKLYGVLQSVFQEDPCIGRNVILGEFPQVSDNGMAVWAVNAIDPANRPEVFGYESFAYKCHQGIGGFAYEHHVVYSAQADERRR